jgi:hypothetical protein
MATKDDTPQLSLLLSTQPREPAIADAGIAPTLPGTTQDTPPVRARIAIKEWPRADRPRDKLLDRGPGILSDAELLSVLLLSGAPGQSALDQARVCYRLRESA